MYDEWRFASACMENVEPGERLLRAERGVLLSLDLKVTHLQQWDIRAIGQEVWRRSGILTRSLGYLRMKAAAPGDVVFTLSRALTPAVALLSTLMLAAAFVPVPSYCDGRYIHSPYRTTLISALSVMPFSAADSPPPGQIRTMDQCAESS